MKMSEQQGYLCQIRHNGMKRIVQTIDLNMKLCCHALSFQKGYSCDLKLYNNHRSSSLKLKHMKIECLGKLWSDVNAQLCVVCTSRNCT